MRCPALFLIALLALAGSRCGQAADRREIFRQLHADGRTGSPAPLPVDVLASIVAHNRGVHAQNPAWVEEKLRRIAGSPWGFYRGTAHLFYEIVRSSPDLGLDAYDPGSGSWILIHGDAHLGNVGASRDARGKVRFDLQDFDESTRGAWVQDVLRAATSVVVSADPSNESLEGIEDQVGALLEGYVDALKDLADGAMDADWSLKEKDAPSPIDDLLDETKKREPKEHLAKRSEVADGVRRFRRTDRYTSVEPDRVPSLAAALADYAVRRSGASSAGPGFFQLKDVVRKMSNGVGSLGVENFLLLVEGPSDDPDDDVILEFKEELTASFDRANGATPAEPDPGRRAARAQGVLQSHPDPYSGWTVEGTHHYLVKEDSVYEENLDLADLDGSRARRSYARVVGKLLAKGHHRQGLSDPTGSDARGSATGDMIRQAIGDEGAFVAALTVAARKVADSMDAAYRVYVESPLADGHWPE